MKVNFNPQDYDLTGCVSFCSWSNPEIQDAIRKAFNESEREEIVEIVIDRQGIKAKFETRSSCIRREQK